MGVCLNSLNLGFLGCTMEPVASALAPSLACCEAIATSTFHVLHGIVVPEMH